MDFTAELTSFQGAIISADNVHQFSKITARGGNEDDILNIVEKLFRFLQEKSYITKDSIKDESMVEMRKFAFYIILNGDFAVLEDLIELPGVDTVIWTIPTVTKCLVCEIIWALHMEHFLYETITFSNPSLSLQVLKPFIDSLKYFSPADCFEKLKLLSQSCYRLIGRLSFFNFESACKSALLTEAFECFLRVITHFIVPPNESKLNTLSEDDLYKYRGNNIYSLISLTLECLNLFSSLETLEPDAYIDIYLCTIKPEMFKSQTLTFKICESPDDTILEYLLKCNTALLDKCMALVMDVSVDIFCAWSEYESNGKSMQQSVGESCYLLMSKINSIENLSQHPICGMLPQISRKPVDIHDIIKLADDTTILENLNKDEENKLIWLDVLLNKDNLLKNREFIECLNININLINSDTLLDLTKKTIHNVKENEDSMEELKVLAVNLFKKCDPNTKIEITQSYFDEKLLYDNMQTQAFEKDATEIFNKIIASPDTDLSEVLNLFIQNPWNTYNKILNSAVRNSDAAVIMLRIMKLLDEFSNHFYRKQIDTCIINVIQAFSQSDLNNETEQNNFINFVTELKKNKLMCGIKLLMLIIMPELHKGLLKRDNSNIDVQLKMLESAYDVEELLPYRAAMLAMIAQILEVTRWTIDTYSPGSPTVLERALKIQIKLFNSYQFLIPEKEKSWLKSKLNGISPLNMYYYKTLWNPPGNNFIEIITGEVNISNEKLTVLLAKILCCATAREWDEIWECMKSHGNNESLNIIYNAVYLTTIAQRETNNATTWACMEHCYRNFVFIIKEKYLVPPLSTARVELVLQKIITIVNFLDEDHVESVSPVFLSLLSFITSRRDDYTLNIQSFQNEIRHDKFSNLVSQLFTFYNVNP